MTKIVGICLVHNDDIFLRRALLNALPFCDRLLVADHQSTDGTAEICEEMASSDSRLEYRRISKPPQSHEWIENLAGKDNWIFGVDGDEIYDPIRLAEFREEILSGKYNDYWQILGNVLHCEHLEGVHASGYLARPARSMTKLYNFSAIESWSGPCSERLHGGKVVYREGYDADCRLRLDDDCSFDDSPFRCLHTVFLPRSSSQPENLEARPNIAEKIAYTPKEKLKAFVLGCFGRSLESRGKQSSYRRGKRVTRNVNEFFPGSQ